MNPSPSPSNVMLPPNEPGPPFAEKGGRNAVPVRSYVRRKPGKSAVFLATTARLREEVALRQFDSEWEAAFEAEVKRDPAFACDAGLVV